MTSKDTLRTGYNSAILDMNKICHLLNILSLTLHCLVTIHSQQKFNNIFIVKTKTVKRQLASCNINVESQYSVVSTT